MKRFLFAISVIFLYSSLSFAQTNNSSLDTLIYINGDKEIGKVEKISEDYIDFKSITTEVVYEISKKRLKEIRLWNGRIIEFIKEEPQKLDAWERQTNPVVKDSGTDSCLLIGGVAGAVILILAVLGALAR